MPETNDGAADKVPTWLEAERRMLLAGAKLLPALREYEQSASSYVVSPLACLEMDESMKSLSAISWSLEQELLRLHQVIGMIEEGTQIAPKSERGVAWKPYLSPRWFLYFADLANPGDPGYLPQLLDRLEAADRRWQEQNAECGRLTKTGSPCRALPVYWPGKGRASACTRHLTSEEKLTVGELWADIERAHACPGCQVSAGQPCSETAEMQILPNGEYPRVRGFAGRMVHDARLELAAPAID